MDKKSTIAPHLSVEQLENYLSDKLGDVQRHLVEKHLLSCALCSDAMEGLADNIVPTALSEDLTDLDRRLKERINEKKKGGPIAWPYYRAAAVVLLLMLSGVVFYFMSIQDQPQDSGLAVEQQEPAPTSDQSVIEKGITDNKSTEEVTESLGESQESDVLADGDADGYAQVQPTEIEQNELRAADDQEQVARSDSRQVPNNIPGKEASQPQLADAGIDQSAARNEPVAAEAAIEDSFEETRSPAPEVKTRSKLTYKPLGSKRDNLLPQTIVPSDPYRTIVGRVISSESGRPLAGIKIEVKDTKFSTFTDNEGDYILAAPLEAQALVMTFQGYTSQELPLQLEREEAEVAVFQADTIASGILDDEHTGGDSLNLGISNYTLAREDTEPIPEGGMEAYVQYLTSKESIDKRQKRSAANLASTVEVSFTVQDDGSLTDFELSKESPNCEDQVIEKIQNGPKWIPGTSNTQKAAKRVILLVPCDL